MFFKRKDEPKNPKYKATYRGSYNGNIKEFAIAEPTEALTAFLQKNEEDIWEMYALVNIAPLSKEE